MMNIMYNFTNVTDEIMTQKELMKSPEGRDFITKWTWPNQECVNEYPRFRISNTVEDYFYVRIVEADLLLAVGAIRIHWKDGCKLMVDNTIQIVLCAHDFNWCEDPRKKYDLESIVKGKIYQYLVNKTIHGRYNNDCNRPAPCPPRPMPPKKHHCGEPYHRGYDDRGLWYKAHDYKPKPCEDRPNPPKNGPYGGTYNAWDDICHK